MYLHLGQSAVVSQRSIIGIFDLDHTSVSARTRRLLDLAEKEGRVVSVSEDLPKSFVLCGEGEGPSLIYLSQLSTATLRGRAERLGFTAEETAVNAASKKTVGCGAPCDKKTESALSEPASPAGAGSQSV